MAFYKTKFNLEIYKNNAEESIQDLSSTKSHLKFFSSNRAKKNQFTFNTMMKIFSNHLQVKVFRTLKITERGHSFSLWPLFGIVKQKMFKWLHKDYRWRISEELPFVAQSFISAIKVSLIFRAKPRGISIMQKVYC